MTRWYSSEPFTIGFPRYIKNDMQARRLVFGLLPWAPRLPRTFSGAPLALSLSPPMPPIPPPKKMVGVLKNEKIPFPKVHLVTENGAIRLVSLKETLRNMDSKENDLVVVSYKSPGDGDGRSSFPICKIVSKKAAFDKHKASTKKPKNPGAVLKELQIATVISDHDLRIKLDKALAFLEKGHKVQFTLLSRRSKDNATPDFSRLLKALQETLEGFGKEHSRSRTSRHQIILSYTAVVAPKGSTEPS